MNETLDQRHGAQPSRAIRADARRNRERILAAARELFTKDPRGTSTNDVCAHAEVGPGTLYRHFASRAELCAAVYIADVDTLLGHATDLSRTEAGWPALEQWLTEYLRYCQDNRDLLGELDHLLRCEPELSATVARRTADAADRVVKQAQKADAVDPELTGTDLIQLVCGIVLPHGSDPPRDMYRLQVILRGIRRGGASESA